MQPLEIFIIGTQFVLFTIILGNIARLISDYLISKIK